MLQCSTVTKYFGGLAALKDVDITIKEKELVGLIGPNGSGKTTLFNCISGIYPPSKGRIVFRGKDITGLRSNQICNIGIGRTFQIVQPFLDMSGLENVMVGGYMVRKNTRPSRMLKKERYPFSSLLDWERRRIPSRDLTL